MFLTYLFKKNAAMRQNGTSYSSVQAKCTASVRPHKHTTVRENIITRRHHICKASLCVRKVTL